MLTFIAFSLAFVGCLNWLMIGLLQYDFVAGIFGWQSSMMSRLVYIAFGIGAVYLLVRVLINKGSVKVWERKKSAVQQTAVPSEGEIVETKTVTKKKKPRRSFRFWKKKRNEVQTAVEPTPPKSQPDEPFSENITEQNKANLFDEDLGQ